MSRLDAVNEFQPQSGDPAAGYITAADARGAVNFIYDDMDNADKALNSRVTRVEALTNGVPPLGTIKDRAAALEASLSSIMARLNRVENGVAVTPGTSTVTELLPPVADAAALPATPADGSIVVTLDDGHMHIYANKTWHDIGAALSTGGVPTSTPGDHGLVLTVTATGTPAWHSPATELPNGQTAGTYLHVSALGDLEWVTLPAGLPDSDPSDKDRHLVVDATGSPQWTDVPADRLPSGEAPGDVLHVDPAGDLEWIPDKSIIPDGANAGDVLAWNENQGEWVAEPPARGVEYLTDLADVDPVIPNDGEVLTFDKSTGKWEPVAPVVTDLSDVVVKTPKLKAMQTVAGPLTMDSGTVIGAASINAVAANTGIGTNSQTATGGTYNTAVGYHTQRATTGSYNVAVGGGTQPALTTGAQDTAIGASCQEALTTGAQNTAVGAFSQLALKTGERNVAVGCSAQKNILASGNTAVGSQAAMYAATAERMVSVGEQAGEACITGIGNVAIGAQSGSPVGPELVTGGTFTGTLVKGALYYLSGTTLTVDGAPAVTGVFQAVKGTEKVAAASGLSVRKCVSDVSDTTAIGRMASADTDGGVAIGSNAVSKGGAVQLGDNAKTVKVFAGPDRLISLSELKTVVAASADFGAFKTAIAALV